MSEQEINNRRCIEYLANECSEEQRITFEIELLFDENLKKTYQEYSLLWQAYPNNNQLLNKVRKRKSTTFKTDLTYWRVACMILAVIGSFFMTYLLFDYKATKDEKDRFFESIYSNLEGVRKKITLEDGSIVEFNGKGSLEFIQNDTLRIAYLEGEAFFDVVKNPQKKFIVKHQDLQVEVIGTQFSVNTITPEKKVALLSGKVLARFGRGEQLYLKPNEQLIWNNVKGEIKRSKSNVEELLGWRNEILIFTNTPLSEALVEINQFYGVTFLINDNVFAQHRITGVFKNQTLEEFKKALCYIANCTITLRNNSYLIEPYA
ncbi:FecR family protein [Myroides injenensis]|uniref:FecR family protein n=1 Tax=Myroides injenensis TaxID=1183151 RepID=UPI000474BEE7|nr:FecR domain-containing protein [Myroides injenensis]